MSISIGNVPFIPWTTLIFTDKKWNCTFSGRNCILSYNETNWFNRLHCIEWQHFYIEPPQHLTFITEIYCWIENDNYIHVADLASGFDSYIVELSFTNKLIFIIWSLYYRVVPFWIKTKRIWIETWLLCILKLGLFLNDTLW